MSSSPRFSYVSNDQLPQDMLDLADAISALPPRHREVLEPLMLRVMESTRRRRRILGLIQEALSQLRLDMKYLVFDLEATRRERDTYRRTLESQGGNDG